LASDGTNLARDHGDARAVVLEVGLFKISSNSRRSDPPSKAAANKSLAEPNKPQFRKRLTRSAEPQ
jgi:hypothetical protein